jgi:hypothetical protein
LKALNEQTAAAQSRLESARARLEAAIAERADRVPARQARVERRREERAERRERQAARKRREKQAATANQILVAHSALGAEATEVVSRAATAIKESCRRVEVLVGACRAENEALAQCQHAVETRQLKLMAQACDLYPVEMRNAATGSYSIRGLALGGADLFSHDEDHASTALGYACHLVFLLSKYLDIPLRYTPLHCASRSQIRDDCGEKPTGYVAGSGAAAAAAAAMLSTVPVGVPGAPGGMGSGGTMVQIGPALLSGGGGAALLPLFVKGADRQRLLRGLQMLTDDVRQMSAVFGAKLPRGNNLLLAVSTLVRRLLVVEE